MRWVPFILGFSAGLLITFLFAGIDYVPLSAGVYLLTYGLLAAIMLRR